MSTVFHKIHCLWLDMLKYRSLIPYLNINFKVHFEINIKMNIWHLKTVISRRQCGLRKARDNHVIMSRSRLNSVVVICLQTCHIAADYQIMLCNPYYYDIIFACCDTLFVFKWFKIWFSIIMTESYLLPEIDSLL